MGTAIVVLALMCALYFLPTIVAFSRDHTQKGAIFLLNFLLGWTIIGWVVSIVWSVTNQQVPQTVIIQQAPPPQS